MFLSHNVSEIHISFIHQQLNISQRPFSTLSSIHMIYLLQTFLKNPYFHQGFTPNTFIHPTVTIKMRRNGLSLPLSCQQIISYLLYCTYLFSYNYLMFRKTISVFHQIDQIFFNALLLLSLSMHLATSLIDPVDPHLTNTNGSLKEEPVRIKCNICQSEIYTYSQHCLKCNKCVYIFDHHCKWVNNCIGKSNYKFFFALLLSTFFLSLFRTVIGISAMVIVFPNELDDHDYISMSFIILMTIISTLVLIFCTYLLVFHIYLGIHRLSTFEYNRDHRKNKRRIVPRTPDNANACKVEGGFSMQTEFAGFSFVQD